MCGEWRRTECQPRAVICCHKSRQSSPPVPQYVHWCPGRPCWLSRTTRAGHKESSGCGTGGLSSQACWFPASRSPLPCPATRCATSNSRPCTAICVGIPRSVPAILTTSVSSCTGSCIWCARASPGGTCRPASAPGTASSAASAAGAKTGSGNACWRPWPPAQADLAQVHLDSTHVRCHVSAVGAADGPAAQGLGRSRGGFGTKLHVLVAAAGRLLRVRLTPGQAGDTP